MQKTESPLAKSAWRVLDIFFHLVHLTIIIFFLFGWMFANLRLAHFLLSLSILASWCGLGIFYGFGYCLVTDLQWKIKRRLMEEPPTEYYMKYLIDKITGLDTKPGIVNGFTTYVFFGVLVLSTIVLSNSYLKFF